MKGLETDNRRVDHLAERLKDDALSDSELGEVKDIIRNQPVARRRLVQLLYLAADLRDVVGSMQGRADTNVVPSGIRRIAWSAGVLLATAAAIALMIWKPWFPESPNGSMVETPVASPFHDPASDAIAVLSRVREVKWGLGTSLHVNQLKQGGLVSAGVLEIESGLVQIDFYSGATVILNGPAKFRLESPDLGRLEYGNLWAHVPTPARGFKIESSAFNLIDLGTEFGMQVDRSGEGQVHVIEGEVEVYPNSTEPGEGHLLTTGQGMELGMDGRTLEVESRPGMFTGSAQLHSEAHENFKLWQTHQKRLRNDTDTLVYYDFQNLSNWDSTLPNVATYSPRDTDGAIVGCKLVEGRWPGKGALAFENSSNRVRLDVPGVFDDLTISCWLRLDDEITRQMALFHPETQQDRFIHWSLICTEPGVAHAHFAQSFHDSYGKEVRRHFHANRNLMGRLAPGDWINLVLVYDSKAGKVSHYKNGKLIAVNEIEEVQKIGIGIADIGNWPCHEWAKGTEWEVRNLVGTIDEFMISKRPYSAEEVHRMWEKGRP
ncbi:MAG: hypothetical protein NWT08_05280 [Akkermansiaceae bacterium]|nr:hypothetical protein [Akkermansiaceae bacterium]